MTNPFQFPNGQLAYSAEDLLELCQQFPDDGVNYLVREDLEKWLSYIGKEDIAQCAANARQTPLEDRQKLEEFLNKCHALSSPESRDIPEQKPEQTPVVEAKIEPTPVAVKTPMVETKPSAEDSANPITEGSPKRNPEPVVQAKSETASAVQPTEEKPSFFKVIAGLIINVLYRDKNKN